MQPGFSTEQQELLSESSFLPFRQLSVSSRPARNAVKHTQKHLRERLNQVQKLCACSKYVVRIHMCEFVLG